ncbi:MAG: hypothetical protein NZM27_01770 [Acetobacteraceae bacterium]|nr:hypothetical protein [Acetobacteraceae bacterium]MDW8397897.1 hypothetical protein [Acetobacteraceae bacterium]
MILREAEPRDAPAPTALVTALNAGQGDPTDRITEARVLADLIGRGAGRRSVVAESDGALVGDALGFPACGSQPLSAVPEARRRGIGRARPGAPGCCVPAAGGDHPWPAAKPRNRAAHALYRRLRARGEEVIAFAVAGHNLERLARG